MYTYKVMIHPNNKQETKIRRTLNKCIECQNIIFDYLDSLCKTHSKFPSCSEVRAWFTTQKKIYDDKQMEKREGMTRKEMRSNNLDTLFYDVSNDALKQQVKDTYNSFIRFFKKQGKYPVKKNYTDIKKSFYIDPFKIDFTFKKVKLEKIANNKKENRQVLNWVNLAEKNRIPTNAKYYNPRVILDKDRFYIVVSVDNEFAPKRKIKVNENKTLGIDVNVKAIVTSDNEFYTSITKDKTYKKTLKKYKRVQRKLSKKYHAIKKTKKELYNSKNYIKNKKEMMKLVRRLQSLKDNHIDNVINSIISKNSSKICIETLDVKQMKEKYNKEKDKLTIEEKNKSKLKKSLAQRIQENPFSKFLSKLTERAIVRDIEIIQANKWYPSSKKCSVCGYKKDDLKLSDRVFICPNCGLKIDRDYNAAINLNKYLTINNI